MLMQPLLLQKDKNDNQLHWDHQTLEMVHTILKSPYQNEGEVYFIA